LLLLSMHPIYAQESAGFEEIRDVSLGGKRSQWRSC
jgi:hypothetical protein